MDACRHARRIHKCGSSGSSQAEWARRKPRLLFRLSGLFLLRLAARKFAGLLFQEPPRITRWLPYGPLP